MARNYGRSKNSGDSNGRKSNDHILTRRGYYSLAARRRICKRRTIKSLYEIEIADQNLEILMRHRAALFSIIGGLFPYAAFTPSVQPIAFVVAFVSIGSFFI